MTRRTVTLIGAMALAVTSVARADDAIPALPSGQKVSLMEVVWPKPGEKPQSVRFRYLAPAIVTKGKGVDGDAAEGDMLVLCNGPALAAVKASGKKVQEIVISLSQQPLKLGEKREDVTQFFEAYDIKDGKCELAEIGE